MSNVIAPERFNYGALDQLAAEDLRALAGRVRCLIKRTTKAIIRVGDELILAKGKLDHGMWESWLQAEFAMSHRTAERFMAAAKWADGKSDAVSLLEPSTVYLLSAPSTPRPISEQAIADTSAGKIPSTEEIRERIRQAKEDGRAVKTRRATEALADIVALLADHLDFDDLRRLHALLESASKTCSLNDIAQAIAQNCHGHTSSASARFADAELAQ
jgi:hypothetical protein